MGISILTYKPLLIEQVASITVTALEASCGTVDHTGVLPFLCYGLEVGSAIYH
jgi:hypothetical protein